jgi:predicted amidophosphoribosyltransferase
MAIFEKIKDTVTTTGQNVVKGTKNMTDTVRLNSQISNEQKLLTTLYAEIGEIYYQHFGKTADGPFQERCANVSSALERIAGCQFELQQIKGMMSCPKCGTEIVVNVSFCSGCGSPVERVPSAPSMQRKFCTDCGAELEADASFCISCGQKAE